MTTAAVKTIQEPDYGRRLMTKVLDDVTKVTPDKLYATITLSDELPYRFRDITFAEVARCVSFLAYWLEDQYGRSDNLETLAFLGIADLRGAVFFHAAVKLGYKVGSPARIYEKCAC